MNNKKITDSKNNQLETSVPKPTVQPAKHPVLNHRYHSYKVKELEIEDTHIFQIERKTHVVPVFSLLRKTPKK
jgi:hypothetical protein